jgi:hypothetical protein
MELAVVVAVTMGANLLISPHSPGWVGLQPHPYLIPIALVASRYGSGAAAALTLLLFIAYQLATGGAHPLQAPHSGLWASCILGGAVLGALFDQYRHRHDQLQQDLRESQLQLQLARQQNEVLESAVAELRSRILGAGQTFGSLYELARQLTTLSPEQLYRSCLELACKQTEASDAHLFLYQEGVLVARAHCPAQARPRRDPAQSGLVRLALQSNQLCSAHSYPEVVDALDPVVVIPLGAGVGVITIENLPFRRFHPATLAELESIGDWTTRALGQLKLYREKEHQVAEEHAAHLHLLEKLGDTPLQPSDLAWLEPIVEPMVDLLLEQLIDSRWKPLLRNNLLSLLERMPRPSRPLGPLERFVADEIPWLRQTQRDLQRLTQCLEGEQRLASLEACLRAQLDRRRMHLLRARALCQPAPPELWEQLLHLPLTREDGADPDRDWIDWAGSELAGALQSSRSVSSTRSGPIQLEELLLDFLGRPDPELVCASLQALGELARHGGQRCWTALGPGTPASLALEFTHHADRSVRRAAFACLGWLDLPEGVMAEARAREAADLP